VEGFFGLISRNSHWLGRLGEMFCFSFPVVGLFFFLVGLNGRCSWVRVGFLVGVSGIGV